MICIFSLCWAKALINDKSASCSSLSSTIQLYSVNKHQGNSRITLRTLYLPVNYIFLMLVANVISIFICIYFCMMKDNSKKVYFQLNLFNNLPPLIVNEIVMDI